MNHKTHQEITAPKQMTMTSNSNWSSVPIQMAGLGTATIDWGDGTPCETVTLLPFHPEDTFVEFWVEENFELKYGYRHAYSNDSPHHITVTGENITHLDCNGICLSDLDVRKNPALTYLDCGNNWLKSLDVSRNYALTYLCCWNNGLKSLDVSRNTALTYLSCLFNILSNLDISRNSALTMLKCEINQIRHLDVRKNTALRVLVCDWNLLTDIDISANTELRCLSCGKNLLTDLDVSKNIELTELDVSNHTHPSKTEFGNNQLISLDVSNHTALKELHCTGNLLTSLNINGCTALEELDCSENFLKNLDVSGCTALTYLDCRNNKLTNLNLSNNLALEKLYGYDNQLQADALNDLFGRLPVCERIEGLIDISINPGINTCNITIAENRGWTILTPKTLTSLPSGIVTIYVRGHGAMTVDWGNGTRETYKLWTFGDTFSHTYGYDDSPRTITVAGKNIMQLYAMVSTTEQLHEFSEMEVNKDERGECPF